MASVWHRLKQENILLRFVLPIIGIFQCHRNRTFNLLIKSNNIYIITSIQTHYANYRAFRPSFRLISNNYGQFQYICGQIVVKY